MTAAIALTESVQDSVLAAVENSQRWTAGAVKAFTATLDGFTAPRSALPFADALPTPEDALKVSFGFAERLLAANRAFVSELLGVATAPASTPTAPAAPTAPTAPATPVAAAPAPTPVPAAPARAARRPATP